MKKNIFIDCGGHCGCSRRFFKKTMDPNNLYEMFSFEPDPEFNVYCDKLINKAVWIKDEVKTFHKFKLKGASSLYKCRADLLQKQVKYSDIRTSIEVECFDIDKWIKENFRPKDKIILKLDVECAEYTILPHMFENGSIDYINKIYIEWHESVKCKITDSFRLNLQKKLGKKKIIWQKWDAMKKGYCFTRGKITQNV